MAGRLQSLAFSAAPREVSESVWGEIIRLKPHQILLWVSLTHRGLERLPPATPRLPVLLDTGHNHNLFIAAIPRRTTHGFP
jgi:hypothetical protein